MAGVVAYTCNDCDRSFTVIKGDLMKAMRLRCERCGSGKSVAIKDLKKAKIDWHNIEEVEKFAGLSSCKGKLKRDAPMRCPGCKSTNLSLNKAQLRIFIN